jgi:hypothetical protein
MKRLVIALAALVLLAASSAHAETITCDGTYVEYFRGEDTSLIAGTPDNPKTCIVPWHGAGHSPLRACGENYGACTVTGTGHPIKNSTTYVLDKVTYVGRIGD